MVVALCLMVKQYLQCKKPSFNRIKKHRKGNYYIKMILRGERLCMNGFIRIFAKLSVKTGLEHFHILTIMRVCYKCFKGYYRSNSANYRSSQYYLMDNGLISRILLPQASA